MMLIDTLLQLPVAYRGQNATMRNVTIIGLLSRWLMEQRKMDLYERSSHDERTLQEFMRGAQVQEHKAKFGADATFPTGVCATPELRERVEKELMRRDRAKTLFRWQDERRIRIEEKPGNRMVVMIKGRSKVKDDFVYFEEHADEFPTVKMVADVSLAMVGMGV